MKTYRIQWEAWTAGVPWFHEFTMPSDKMALEYAERAMLNCSKLDLGRALLLWDMSDQSLVGRFVLDKPTVHNTVDEVIS